MGYFEDAREDARTEAQKRVKQAHNEAAKLATQQQNLSKILLDAAKALLPELRLAIATLRSSAPIRRITDPSQDPDFRDAFYRYRAYLEEGVPLNGWDFAFPTMYPTRLWRKNPTIRSWTSGWALPTYVLGERVPGLPSNLDKELQSGGSYRLLVPKTGAFSIALFGLERHIITDQAFGNVDRLIANGRAGYSESTGVASTSGTAHHAASLPGVYFGAIRNIAEYLESDGSPQSPF